MTMHSKTPSAIHQPDIIVIGAGPAGMQTAATASDQGLRVLVLDEQDKPGGQIYRALIDSTPQRQRILGPDYTAGVALLQAFQDSSADYWGNSTVWQVTRDKQVYILRHGKTHVLSADAIVLATGAMERPFPVPGWTLPGVMTAGAAQILLKGEGVVPAQPAVLMGCGPLLYLLAWQYLQANVPVKAVIETTERVNALRALRYFPGALSHWSELKKGMSMIRALRRAGVTFYKHAHDMQIHGETKVVAVSFKTAGKRVNIPTDLVLLHQGIVPNTQVSWGLRAGHSWDTLQRAWTPDRDDCGQLDIPGFYLVGDGAGIAGAKIATMQGKLTGLAIARALDKTLQHSIDADIRTVQANIAKNKPFRRFLNALYPPVPETLAPPDDVIVCRCENITAGIIRAQLRNGSTDPNQIKSFVRCGMGPCQGRQCGLTLIETMAQHQSTTPDLIGYYRIRPPLKPITLDELAQDESN